MARPLGVCKTTYQRDMDSWMEKFEPLIKSLLKTEPASPTQELDFFMSKLDLEDNKVKVFEVLTELHYCDCCYKHQIDKPCIPSKWSSEKVPTAQELSCMCDCRHTARMICRMCD